jgi:hypothetical protein
LELYHLGDPFQLHVFVDWWDVVVKRYPFIQMEDRRFLRREWKGLKVTLCYRVVGRAIALIICRYSAWHVLVGSEHLRRTSVCMVYLFIFANHSDQPCSTTLSTFILNKENACFSYFECK